jgi:c-di-GMP-related signal transduction protein
LTGYLSEVDKLFIARQPIFDRKMEVFGYELLFRLNSESRQFGGASSLEATGSVIGELFESGIESIVEDKQAFVNFDEEFIHSDSIELISPTRLVVEMLEDVSVDENLIVRLGELKSKGYRIALDDFVEDYSSYPLIGVADIIKYDIRETPLKSIKLDVDKAIYQRKILLAEKVETKEEFWEARDMGFNLFQGYFFSKPRIVGKSIEHNAPKAQYSILVEELRKPEPSYQVIAELIEKDVNLSYRLMRAIKARSGESLVHSIKRALTYMGFKEIERWVTVIMLQSFGKSKPKELLNMSILRSKFMEKLSEHSELSGKRHEAFMMGLFSTVDAILDQPMEDALGDIAIPKTVYDALVLKSGELYPIYELGISYERGDWKRAKQIARSLKIDEKNIYRDYLESIDYVKSVCRGVC